RDYCLLSRIMRAARRQDDDSTMREPGQQQPQKQKVSKMIDCKGCLESVGAAGVVIRKQRAGIQYQGVDLSRTEFRFQRQNEGSHVLQAHQVERECSRSWRTRAACSEQQPRIGCLDKSPGRDLSQSRGTASHHDGGHRRKGAPLTNLWLILAKFSR